MMTLLLAFALVLAIIAAFIEPYPIAPRFSVHFGWLSLAFFIASFIKW